MVSNSVSPMGPPRCTAVSGFLSPPLGFRLRSSVVRILLGVAFATAYLAQSIPVWSKVQGSRSARDFATYHYAVQAAAGGEDPYSKRVLGKAARRDKTRRSVHPYFYPPPFLVAMTWTLPLSLATAYRLWFWANQLFLVGTLLVLRRWLQAPWVLLLGVCAICTPLPDNMMMGQANLLVGLLVVVGLWRSNGVAIGTAGMFKMSPALYLLGWAARVQWRPVGVAAATAVGLSLVSLPLVGLDLQTQFFTEVLPGFGTGQYNGLTVPITLPANHSVPDLFNQLWPGPTKHTLSAKAATGARGVSVLLLGATAWAVRAARGTPQVASAFGALSIVLLVTPVYTYEHHLSLLVFPLVASGTVFLKQRAGHLAWTLWGLGAGLSCTPLGWLRAAKEALPGVSWWIQESKFLGLLLVGTACLLASQNRTRGA